MTARDFFSLSGMLEGTQDAGLKARCYNGGKTALRVGNREGKEKSRSLASLGMTVFLWRGWWGDIRNFGIWDFADMGRS
ncbi:MAG: hypothetical protein WBL50_00170, partial [Candidatus Acidiferrum sp.]